MKILSFVEGANPCMGGTGIGGVHEIMSSLVKRGHEVVLNMTGFPNPGTEDWVQLEALTALEWEMGSGNYGIVVSPCVFHRQSFSPTMLQSILPYIRDTDFIALHFLYSFPVVAGYLLAQWFHKLWPHGVLAPIQRQINSVKKKIYGWLIARAILNNASVMVYTSQGEREETRCLHLKSLSVVIPHGFDVQGFDNLRLVASSGPGIWQGIAGP